MSKTTIKTTYQHHVLLYIGELLVAEVVPTSPIDPETGEAEMGIITIAWPRCKTRKRMKKLLCGVMGIQRNVAEEFIEAAMESGCPSYQQLWEDTREWLMREIVEAVLDGRMPAKTKEITIEMEGDNDND